MALRAIDPATLPTRSAGQTSIPEDEQAQLLAMVSKGQSASDGSGYATSKEARKAGGPYLRFVKALIKAGTLVGGARFRTFPTGKDGKMVGWAVFVDPDAASSDEADEAE
jgi:hypothetical protein